MKKIKISDIPLREKKFALKKIELLNVILDKTRTKRLDEIAVKEICDSALISEGTFFNYFSRKTDLLSYFIQLWTIESIYLAEKEYGNTSGLKKIEFVFQCTSNNKTIGNERIIYEIISYHALGDKGFHINMATVTTAEKLIAFPQHQGIELINAQSFDQVFMDYLKLAVALGEIPPIKNVPLVRVMLGSIFFGVPMSLKGHSEMILPLYSESLESLWKAIRYSAG